MGEMSSAIVVLNSGKGGRGKRGLLPIGWIRIWLNRKETLNLSPTPLHSVERGKQGMRFLVDLVQTSSEATEYVANNGGI